MSRGVVTLKFGSQRVRLYGIDAPEMKQTCDDGAWAGGVIAREALVNIIGVRPVTCEQVDWDSRYGRPVSRCMPGATDVSEAMVASGMAWAFVRYSTTFVEQERQAATSALGVHAHKCIPAWEWRAQQRALAILLTLGRIFSGADVVPGNLYDGTCAGLVLAEHHFLSR